MYCGRRSILTQLLSLCEREGNCICDLHMQMCSCNSGRFYLSSGKVSAQWTWRMQSPDLRLWQQERIKHRAGELAIWLEHHTLRDESGDPYNPRMNVTLFPFSSCFGGHLRRFARCRHHGSQLLGHTNCRWIGLKQDVLHKRSIMEGAEEGRLRT